MGWLQRLFGGGRATESGGAERWLPTPSAALAVELAEQLIGEYGEDVPVRVLVDRSDERGLPASDVDRAVDQIIRDRRVVRSFVETGGMRIVDLRGLDCVRMKVKGTGYYVEHASRRAVGDTVYVLVREPANEHDANAIAVVGREGRKVGHVSASRAGIMAPLLDRIGADGYRVGGANGTETSTMLWVDIPKADALRAFVRSAHSGTA